MDFSIPDYSSNKMKTLYKIFIKKKGKRKYVCEKTERNTEEYVNRYDNI